MRKPVAVTVVAQRGPSVVVQWQVLNRQGQPAGARRTTVPAEAVVDGACEMADLRAGISESVDWAAAYQSSVTPERVAVAFERLGIWTVQDLMALALQAQKAVTTLAVDDLYGMIRRLQHADE